MDTNILVYAVDQDDPAKHASAKRFLDVVHANPGRFYLSVQNIREFAFTMYIKTKAPPQKIQEYIREFGLVFSMVADTPEDAHTAVEWAFNLDMPFWDGLLMSTARRNGITTIYTENVRDFKKNPGIKTVNPLA